MWRYNVMGITVQEESSNLRVMRVTGLLKKSELDTVQASEAKKLDEVSHIKLLIIVEDF
jgi:hypothetical protein